MVKITSAQRAANAWPRPESSLDDDRACLGRGRNVEGTARPEPAAFVVDIVHPAGIGVDAARLIEYEGVVVPAPPELEGQLDELVGTVVPPIVVEVRVDPKFRASLSFIDVTTFHAARPPER